MRSKLKYADEVRDARGEAQHARLQRKGNETVRIVTGLIRITSLDNLYAEWVPLEKNEDNIPTN